MSTDPTDGEHTAEVVPLHAVPAPEAPAETTPAGPPVPPAPPVYADLAGDGAGKRLPIIPPDWQRGGIRGTLRQLAERRWYQFRFHGLRLPLHAAVLAACVIRGAHRIAASVLTWWHWTAGWVLESQAVAGGPARHGEAMAVHKEGKKTRAARGRIVGVCAAGFLAVVLAILAYAPWQGQALIALAACALLARHGRPDGGPIIRRAIIPDAVRPPTPEIITRALCSIGIAAINAAVKEGPLAFVADVHRDGPGWGVQLDLPHGVIAKQIIAKREELASGLRRPLSATWPAEVPEVHSGRLDLWIGFTDLAKAKAPAWPLLRAGQADVFGTVPFGTDPRGRTVPVPLFEVNWLIGAAPGQGKTAGVRVLGCGAALDPLADLWVHELAGKGDLDLSRVCHRYTSGIDDESIEYAAESARMLRKETERRSAMFKKLKGTGVMPDGKVTRELAGKYRALRPLVAIFDEVQNLLMAGDLGKQAASDLAYAIRVGRAMAITVILATQRPNNDSVPASVSGLIISRFCLMVPGQIENDMVLGTSAYRNGYKATTLRPKVDAGFGWLKGSEDGIPQVVHAYYLNLKATARIVDRARAIREAAGVLSGVALGLDDSEAPRSFLADVLQVFGADDKLWSPTIADRLAGQIPGAYEGITAEAVASQLRNAGVAVKDVRESGGPNRKGCERAAVEAVAANPGG